MSWTLFKAPLDAITEGCDDSDAPEMVLCNALLSSEILRCKRPRSGRALERRIKGRLIDCRDMDDHLVDLVKLASFNNNNITKAF